MSKPYNLRPRDPHVKWIQEESEDEEDDEEYAPEDDEMEVDEQTIIVRVPKNCRATIAIDTHVDEEYSQPMLPPPPTTTSGMTMAEQTYYDGLSKLKQKKLN